MKCTARLLLLLVTLASIAPSAAADSLGELARDFWAWRAAEQPFSGDDIPRIERPEGWRADWSAGAFVQRRKDLLRFEERWKSIDASQRPIPEQVDYRLMGSAIARVRWELEIVRGWQRNPVFYVDQTLGSIFVALTQPPPFDAKRSAEILARLRQIPRTVAEARENLSDAAAPFARLAINQLSGVRANLARTARALKPLLDGASAAQLDAAAEQATAALEEYREWLKKRLPEMQGKAEVGREGFEFFLKRVALTPYTPEQLVAMARQEWERAVAFEMYEHARDTKLAPLPLFKDQAAQIARSEEQEKEIRRLLEEKNILSIPARIRHYRKLPLPAYLEPLGEMGVPDDLTGPSRLDQDGVSYIPVPAENLGYFAEASARDPRPIIVHEGVPGHYFQLTLGWGQEDPIRRHYYDSGANEGIGFYGEEMMLQAGLFDDSPRSREIIYNFMRFRALRVEVDVKLATGEFTVDQATDYFVKMVPMDRASALEDAALYAAAPGIGISYQTGKLQILKFLAEARRAEGEKFSLRKFHDFLWNNGNVPIALQRWEYLGLTDEMELLR
ncbi:MAG: DUF885 domain-containing protein [Acidobacteriia bacterium]|nr:DUF885 domain-containing protein [Terriglobia bacterium]